MIGTFPSPAEIRSIELAEIAQEKSVHAGVKLFNLPETFSKSMLHWYTGTFQVGFFKKISREIPEHNLPDSIEKLESNFKQSFTCYLYAAANRLH